MAFASFDSLITAVKRVKRIGGDRRGLLDPLISGMSAAAGSNGYRVGHGMIGTVLIAFAGEPLIILVLMAR